MAKPQVYFENVRNGMKGSIDADKWAEFIQRPNVRGKLRKIKEDQPDLGVVTRVRGEKTSLLQIEKAENTNLNSSSKGEKKEDPKTENKTD